MLERGSQDHTIAIYDQGDLRTRIQLPSELSEGRGPLFATALAFSLDMDPEDIQRGLCSFSPSF